MEVRPSASASTAGEILDNLPTPLASLPLVSRRPEEFVATRGGPLSICQFQAQQGSVSGLLLIGTISLAELRLICVKTTPLLLKPVDQGVVSVGLSYAGKLVYAANGHRHAATPGDLLICPNNGGFLTTELCSGIGFQFEPKRLLRTMAVMVGHDHDALDLTQPHLLATSNRSASGQPGGLMRELCTFIDRLLQEDDLIPEAMGLEEQCFRSLALEWLHANGKLDGLRRRRHHPQREAFLDDLLDFIMANLHRPITLTDLEEQSNYSGRQLQYMFRRKFNCTPLQFVRRQRLKFAMARLEQSQPNETITGIARELGYRSTSSFSADFFRQFGTYPSVVLRSRRPRAGMPTRPGPNHDGVATSPPVVDVAQEGSLHPRPGPSGNGDRTVADRSGHDAGVGALAAPVEAAPTMGQL